MQDQWSHLQEPVVTPRGVVVKPEVYSKGSHLEVKPEVTSEAHTRRSHLEVKYLTPVTGLSSHLNLVCKKSKHLASKPKMMTNFDGCTNQL